MVAGRMIMSLVEFDKTTGLAYSSNLNIFVFIF